MPGFVIVMLLGTWVLVAYQVYQVGNGTLALVLVLVGLALALWRVFKS